MHPAASIILFSTLSGLGLGLLAFLGLGVPRVSGGSAIAFFGIGFALAVGGLCASTFHLGHPERALKAFRQWRTSWLSREAWLALCALGLSGLHAALIVLWDLRIAPLGWLAAALCLGTVHATSMIYGSLRSVPRWNHASVPVLFLGHAVAGGALLAGQVGLATWLLPVLGLGQFLAWKTGDGRLAQSGSDIASATGLGGRGLVRSFEPPHTGPSYLTREMVFVIGRKHALKLRSIALVLGYLAPALCLLLPFSHLLAGLAVLSHLAGVLVSRWLFFAEAEHVLGFYYGKR